MLSEVTKEKLTQIVFERELENLEGMSPKDILRCGVMAIDDYDDQSLIDSAEYIIDCWGGEDEDTFGGYGNCATISELKTLIDQAKAEVIVHALLSDKEQ
jgi:hypothetical protein